ncbi:hypothetical protein CIB95_12600 [Lottiidibacillus patelloidae]|uniref:Uncharacterized protein n=1 Tax=Lottiidibacillus patelloidae TaxID=2670334 RepID=A0A263BSB1_9BACI|nr:hypothetical protein [Lottiidibacillus patelloidae]OZM56257.1 hypothetical protein CIB95_12600 [Lottiidibacillus patelloidae]
MFIPHFIFPGLIEKSRGKYSQNSSIKPFYYYDLSEILNKLDLIIIQLNKERKIKEIHCWFIIEETISAKFLPEIISYLHKELDKTINVEKSIRVHIIPGSKESPLEEIMVDFEPVVHEISIKYPFSKFGHVVSFGDPIPEQALFLEGIRQWEDRYESVYYNETSIHTVNTTIKGKTEQWTKQFRAFILDHDYYAAFLMVDDLPVSDLSKGLKSLLHMMIDRFNFAFEDASIHLKEAKKYLGERSLFLETESVFEKLNSTNKKEKDLALIVELFRQLDVYLDMGDMSAFLIRFYRAREAIMHYLYHYAQTNQVQMQVKKKKSFHSVIEQMEEMYESWELDGYYGAYFFMKSQNVADTLKFRNNSFIGHGRSGISEQNLWKEYTGYFGITKEKAKRRFVSDTSLLLRDLGVNTDENITKINRFILRTIVKGILPNEAFINSPI